MIFTVTPKDTVMPRRSLPEQKEVFSHMLKVKTKFRVIIAFYMLVPTILITYVVYHSDLFLDHAFQSALILCLAMITFIALCSPWLIGFNWLFFRQIKEISAICAEIKNGDYRYLFQPNEPLETGDENELIFLKRNIKWMIRKIEMREIDLERQVAKRTRALEKTNAKLIVARDKAKASATAKSQFLATMSHEIRTPLNAVIGMSDTVLKTRLDSYQEECIGIIASSSRSLLKIINDILDFSKMEAGKFSIESIPVPIHELLEEVSDIFRHETADKSLEFIIDVADHVPEQFLADPFRLRQLLINLVSNAFKFTAEGEITIRVSVEPTGSEPQILLFFSICDTGVGMDTDTLQTLFNPFTQADGSTSRKYGGTGLGLAISKRLAILMGGDITVQSTPGEGSCFTLTIKVTPLQSPAEQHPDMRIEAFQGKPVLLAARNPITCRVLERFLAAFGFTVTCHTNWTRAKAELIRKHLQQPYFLAVIDMELNDIDFTDSRGSTGNYQPACPVVGFGCRNERELFNPPSWVAKILSKPVKQSTLFAAIIEAVTKSASGHSAARIDQRAEGQRPHPADGMTSLQVEQAMEMTTTLKNLLDQNSLKAKEYSRQFSGHLAGTSFEAEARILEGQIRLFDFEKAKKTFASLSTRVCSVHSDRLTVN